MAYYVIHNSTGDLIYLSETEPSNDDYNAQGHHVCETHLTEAQINSDYEWSKTMFAFVLRDKKILSRLEFLKKFTIEEYAAIKQATQQNSTLDYHWQMYMIADKIDMRNADFIVGVTLLKDLNLITEARATEILNG